MCDTVNMALIRQVGLWKEKYSVLYKVTSLPKLYAETTPLVRR